jgi:ketosteroid isomerase-like protein
MVLPSPLCPPTVPASLPRVTCVIALALSLGGLAPQLHAQAAQASRSDSASAVATVTRFHDALSARDSVTAVSLLASDAMILESGVIESRADYVGHHLAADMKAGQGAKRTRAVVRVTLLGDAAYVVTKTTTPATNADGSNGSEMAELMVLSKAGSGWTIRAVHWSSRRRRA